MAEKVSAEQIQDKINGILYDVGAVTGQMDVARRNYDHAYFNLCRCEEVSLLPSLEHQFAVAGASFKSVQTRMLQLRKEHMALRGKWLKANAHSKRVSR